ncbi:metal ABC transporter substrate-binding protein [Microlunatus elymi]|nr:metal ABC transporter substrate-binding protein [Microlunatus elymi]
MPIFPRALGLLLGIGSLLLLAACGAVTGTGSDGSRPGQLRIVASFYPFQFVAERVAGSHATVESLTKPGAEPHDLELTPKQVGSVTDADLVVYEQHFQAAVDEAVAQSGNQNVLDTTSVVPLQDHGPLGEDEHDDHDHAGNANLDPHVWLDPNNMIKITDAVADKLTKIDPDHAADYHKNVGALDADLRQLDDSYREGLKTCQRTEFVTSHAAFGYLAERYGLQQISISGLSPDNEPSPARIAEVQHQISKYDVTTIFYETLASPAVAQSIARDLGLRTDVLDPIEGITEQSRGTNYLAVMKSNLTALEKANGCS